MVVCNTVLVFVCHRDILLLFSVQYLCTAGDCTVTSHLIHEGPKVPHCVYSRGTSSAVSSYVDVFSHVLFNSVVANASSNLRTLLPSGTATALPSSCAVFMRA